MESPPTFITLWKATIQAAPGEFNRPRRELWIERKNSVDDPYYRAVMVTSSSMIDILFHGYPVEVITFDALAKIRKMFPDCVITPYRDVETS